MKIDRNKFDHFLHDMVVAMKRIMDYTQGLSYHEFTTNSLIRDAVIRNFEVLGESVKHIPFGFQKRHRIIPWQRMFELRNFIIHEYFDVDDEILWQIIHVDLSRNKQDLENLLKVSADDFIKEKENNYGLHEE